MTCSTSVLYQNNPNPQLSPLCVSMGQCNAN